MGPNCSFPLHKGREDRPRLSSKLHRGKMRQQAHAATREIGTGQKEKVSPDSGAVLEQVSREAVRPPSLETLRTFL